MGLFHITRAKRSRLSQLGHFNGRVLSADDRVAGVGGGTEHAVLDAVDAAAQLLFLTVDDLRGGDLSARASTSLPNSKGCAL
jgi:hypothetical protein